MVIHEILLPFAFAELLKSYLRNIILVDTIEMSNYIELILIIFEFIMIVFGIYPKFISVRLNRHIGALIFYLTINIISNMLLIIAFGSGLGV